MILVSFFWACRALHALTNSHSSGGYATYAIAGIYALDIIGRLSSMRIKYVEVEAMEGGMTRVGIRGIKGGWR